MSDKYKKLKRLFMCLSYGIWFICTIFLVVCAFSAAAGNVTVTEEVFTVSAKNKLLALSTTVVIGIVGTILIKDKLRTATWMANVVLAAVMFNRVGMYIILGLWFLEEYVFRFFYKKYENLYVINREIDKRG